MGSFFSAIKRGFQGMTSANGPARFIVEDRPVRCPHCGHDLFAQGSALLNTVGMTFAGLDWANRSAFTLMCVECSRLEWFGQEPTRVVDASS